MIIQYHKTLRQSLPSPPGWPAILAVLLVGFVFLPQAAHGQSSSPELAPTMDQAIAILDKARLQFQNVKDYECRLIKRERIGGVLFPESELTMKSRTQPFSMYLRCESQDSDKGMEICYVSGLTHGMMRVHPNGLVGVLGFWSLDTHDPRAMKKSRHAITEAGFGNLLDSTARYWEMERRLNKTVVHIGEETIGGRPCIRIETAHPERTAGNFYGYRCVLWLDKETNLPAGAETYDWPGPESPEGGNLLESYRFLDLRFNVGLDEKCFNR
jgi:hypothetical protein